MNTPVVFKFGGASVKDAESVQNIARIISNYPLRPMVVVVSAMGKMTNALERVVEAWNNKNTSLALAEIEAIETFHQKIIDDLFEIPPAELLEQIEFWMQSLKHGVSITAVSYSKQYDFIVHFGEFISTRIISTFVQQFTPSVWLDTTKMVKTDHHFRRATVDWQATETAITASIQWNKVNFVQGFIGSDPDDNPTTLGREGSDYSGAVFAYCLKAANLTIWKDVPGLLNGDPKIFKNTQKIHSLPYAEAIELAFYGASIIHPKTIQPMQRRSIPLHIKSFMDPTAAGTVISEVGISNPEMANFILKRKQALLEISTTDLAFIVERHLSAVYALFASNGIVVNLMRNTATKAIFCIDNDRIIVPKVIRELETTFQVELQEKVELLTIRHYSSEDERRETQGLHILQEQRTPDTVQFVFKRS